MTSLALVHKSPWFVYDNGMLTCCQSLIRWTFAYEQYEVINQSATSGTHLFSHPLAVGERHTRELFGTCRCSHSSFMKAVLERTSDRTHVL